MLRYACEGRRPAPPSRFSCSSSQGPSQLSCSQPAISPLSPSPSRSLLYTPTNLIRQSPPSSRTLLHFCFISLLPSLLFPRSLFLFSLHRYKKSFISSLRLTAVSFNNSYGFIRLPPLCRQTSLNHPPNYHTKNHLVSIMPFHHSREPPPLQ